MRFPLSATLLAAVALTVQACSPKTITDLPRKRPDPVIESAIDSFFNATQSRPVAPNYIKLHSVMLVQKGKVIGERWFNGSSADLPHTMWSVSKTFTGAAVGMCIGDGLLTLDDKIVELFPDDLPEKTSENLEKMTVWNLLTMTCGHTSETTVRHSDSADWVQGFLAHPVDSIPGSFFFYNSMGSYMLSAAVTKVTGKKLVDFLDERLFRPLNIEKPSWEESPQGMNCGGWGLDLKTEDMAKMGQLLLNGGKWNGKQIIPMFWVREMMSFQTRSKVASVSFEDLDARGFTKEKSDWVQGYGYQMWLCRHNAVRADGANGQYIIVIPEKEAVIVITTDSNMYQPYVDMIWEYLYPVL